jgi:hypothetical protein
VTAAPATDSSTASTNGLLSTAYLHRPTELREEAEAVRISGKPFAFRCSRVTIGLRVEPTARAPASSGRIS